MVAFKFYKDKDDGLLLAGDYSVSITDIMFPRCNFSKLDGKELEIKLRPTTDNAATGWLYVLDRHQAWFVKRAEATVSVIKYAEQKVRLDLFLAKQMLGSKWGQLLEETYYHRIVCNSRGKLKGFPVKVLIRVKKNNAISAEEAGQ